MKIFCRQLNLDVRAPLSKSVYHRELIINYILGARGPYLDELPDVITEAFQKGSIVPDKLKKAISEEGWRFVINKWIDIFKRISA